MGANHAPHGTLEPFLAFKIKISIHNIHESMSLHSCLILNSSGQKKSSFFEHTLVRTRGRFLRSNPIKEIYS